MKLKCLFTALLVASVSMATAAQSRSSHAHPRGYRGFADVGYTIGLEGGDKVEFSTSHGFQICPYFFMGAGAAINYHFDGDLFEIPLFLDLRSDFLKSKVTPFVDFKAGYTLYDANGFYMNPSLGLRIAIGRHAGLNICVGYEMQKLKINYSGYRHGYRFSGSKIYNDDGVSLRLGFDF